MYIQLSKTASAPLLGLTFCFSLCACSTTSETFDCPAGKGVGCKSISEVNYMVNRGESPHASLGNLEERGLQSTPPLSAPVISADTRVVDSPGVETLFKQSDIPLSDTMAVHRIQEEHLRVWIAPYQDAQGNLHEGSIVHTVLKPGSWQVRVADSRISDPRVVDSRGSDLSIPDSRVNDTSIDDPGGPDAQFSGSEEYP
jgi:conjugal transfer pilus assembly protein TraV